MPSTFVLGVDFGTTYSTVYAHRTFQHPTAQAHVDTSQIAFHIGNLIKIGHYLNTPPSGPPIDVPTLLLFYPKTKKIEWGWGARLSLITPTSLDYIKFEDFKLLLDKKECERPSRQALIKNLQRVGWTLEDLIYEYLVRLLQHAKERLSKSHGLSDEDLVQLVATVPAIWDGSADTIMANCFSRVAKQLKFGHQNDVFLVSEPEAVATYTCQQDLTYPFLEQGDCFLICDNGGGTCDLILYKLDHTNPPRLSEIVAGDGGACGSAYVNEAYRLWLHRKLRSETQYKPLDDPDTGGFSKVVEMAIPDFEIHAKRQFGEEHEPIVTFVIPIHHRVNQSVTNYLHEDRSIMEGFFEPPLNRIVDLIRSQISRAEVNGHVCKKVIFAGGFSTSAYLQDFLQKAFPKLHFKFPDGLERDNMIAAGAVMRYLNRLTGPSEIIRASYGFLRNEQYLPEIFEGHKGSDPYTDKADRLKYVADCVAYFVKKGDIIPPGGQVFDLQNVNSGKLEWTIQDFNEDLEVCLHAVENRSLTVVENHFPQSHERNNGCVTLGELKFTVSKEQLLAYQNALLAKLQHDGLREGTYLADDTGVEILSKRLHSSKKKYFVLHYQVKFRKLCKNIQYELWIGGHRKAVGQLITKSHNAPVNVSEALQNLEI